MIEELIQDGQYTTALNNLNDLDDEKVRLLRLICLNALGEYERAKEEGIYAKANARETYYDVIAQYVVTLKELEEYEEAIDLLIEELSMPYIPYNYESTFNAAYDEILLAKSESSVNVEGKSQIFSISEIELLLQKDDVNDDLLYMALDQLQQLNIRMILPTIKEYLRNPNKNSFSKSLIMEVLVEQQIDEDFEVYKFKQYYDFNPAYAPHVLEQESYRLIGQEIIRVLEDENPSLMHQCIDYLEYYLYAIYPREIYDDYRLIAASLHFYLATMLGITYSKDDVEIDYNVSFEDVEKQMLALKEIE